MADKMEAPPAAPQQYKQPSRKGKKAWRKNVDVSEVQEGLEVVRDEVIHGYVYLDSVVRYKYGNLLTSLFCAL